MEKRINSFEELEELFGKPENGVTGFHLSGIFNNKIIKDGEETGFFINGQFNNCVLNSQNEQVAWLNGVAAKWFYRMNNAKTNYFLGGKFGCEICYDPRGN